MTAVTWSRRAFLQTAAAASASASVNERAKISKWSIEFVATAETIDVYRREARGKQKIQSVASQHASSLTPDITGRYLFAVNEIDEFQGLPTGSVESYRVDSGSGHLTLISRKSLSLSATRPKGMALSPEGHLLVVAAYGGGLYNVLSIRSSGEFDNVTQIIKEIGSSIRPDRQSSAHPHSVVFHPSGRFLIGTDPGADRINVFSVEDGHLSCVRRLPTPSGAGPAGLAIDSSGRYVSVEHAFGPLVARYRFDASSANLVQISHNGT
jgi:6-phosphogluconolactonase (cycloisomerase 2 family)